MNSYPKLHNAMWPGLVGKGSPGAEPCISLDTMLNLTAKAQVNGIKFDGVDLFLFDPHISIDSSDSDLKKLADKIARKGFVVGSVVAPIWPPTGGGSAMGSAEDRQRFVQQVRKGCRIAAKLREFGIRPYGIVRIDTACGVEEWEKDPAGNTSLIAETFREACNVAEGFGERLACEGEICWGGLHSWKEAVKLLELVDRPRTLGFQADMAHTLLYLLGYNKPEDALLPPDWNWQNPAAFDDAYQTLTAALRPWTVDFHVAQNDATVKGSGTHDKTGRHCLPQDPNGKLDVTRCAGYWLRDEHSIPNLAIEHMCWDGCMFPNEVMMNPQTWNEILAAMIKVRNAHGWRVDTTPAKPARETVAEILTRVVKSSGRKTAVSKPAKKAAPKKAPKKAVAKKAPKKAAKPSVPKKPAKKTAPARKPAAKKPAKKTIPAKKPAAKRAVKPARRPAQKAKK